MEASQPSKGMHASPPFISSWTSTPLPSFSLSAGGLLALADLGTVARRTSITGGACWLDALVLAPGLHHQQAADALDAPAAELGPLTAMTREGGGAGVRRVRNVATVNYLERLCGEDGGEETVTVNVGLARQKNPSEAERALATILLRWRRREAVDVDWLSNLLYLLSPLLTVAAVTMMVLLRDWWGLSFLLALMLSRALNILTIRNRSRPCPPPSAVAVDTRPAEYVVAMGAGRRRVVVLRGRADDLDAVTSRAWLRGRSPRDGYREAAGKILVYAVAACSGNMTQAGALVLAALLLLSAALLGLSNACARGLRMHGRVARPERRMPPAAGKANEEEGDVEEGRRDGFPVEDVRGS